MIFILLVTIIRPSVLSRALYGVFETLLSRASNIVLFLKAFHIVLGSDNRGGSSPHNAPSPP